MGFYLGLQIFFFNFSYKQNIIKCLENMYSFYEIFPDHGDLGFFLSREGC